MGGSQTYPYGSTSTTRGYALAALGVLKVASADEIWRLMCPGHRDNKTIRNALLDLANRTYQNYRGELQELVGCPSGLKEQGDRWLATYNPYYPDTAWLWDHRGQGRWIAAEFIHRHLMTDPWTQYMWEDTEAQLAADDGQRARDQESLALAVQQRRRRTRRGPAGPRGEAAVFQGVLRPQTDEADPDPYAGVVFDPDAIEAYPSLPIAGRDGPPPASRALLAADSGQAIPLPPPPSGPHGLEDPAGADG
ncbi:hypothetical protein [Streptomyces sp. NPDC057910]|uniref:hypothetical protein n=1 Tax=Streptomyces sp. NPDC057910 TaxID=3346278 RepID=UPI0036E2F709